MSWTQHWKKAWLLLTIKKKIWFFTGIVFGMAALSILFDSWVVHFSVHDFQDILEENARSSELLDAIELESSSFAAFIRHPGEEREKALEAACIQTKTALMRLPYSYTGIGEYRYAKTWSIRNGYSSYEQKRDAVIKMAESDPDYIKKLYEVYDMQMYLQEYARSLMTFTLKTGTDTYLSKLPYLKGVIVAVAVFSMVLLFSMVKLTKVMNQTIILPIIDLVRASKRIASNDFEVEDVKVYNQDEMGELVKAFNKMKQETSRYIHVLEEKRAMMALLHREEVEKLEIEKQLEMAKFELIKNQIKPHFLFNTLNVIGGMAKLENAGTTVKMIQALSALFRYNLKTPESEVSMEQELQVVRDYMYLQQMRFGSRVGCHMECKLDAKSIKVPTFSLQPIVENAIIHGLCRKEQGGTVYIRIWQEARTVIVSIADTGVGIPEEKLVKLQKELEGGTEKAAGIGLGNIYARIHAMYQDGKVEIFSKENAGTVVRLIMPQPD